jgi:hypothetical protein
VVVALVVVVAILEEKDERRETRGWNERREAGTRDERLERRRATIYVDVTVNF